MAESTLAIVGGGNMGGALLAGLLAAHWAPPGELSVVEIDPARRDELRATHPEVQVVTEVPRCRAAVIAVKPAEATAATRAAAAAGARRILSIAAGITLDELETAAREPGRQHPVATLRAMPNTAALVRQGVAAIAPGRHATHDDVAWAEGVMRAVGTAVRVPEAQLDAVTGLAGSGPAYLFLVAEALIDAGVLAGLSRATSEALVAQLMVGSAALLAERGDAPSLRAMVTSPGGTTAAGLRVLEGHGVRAAFLEAVVAATERSRELGRR